jgi:hypothetical protein
MSMNARCNHVSEKPVELTFLYYVSVSYSVSVPSYAPHLYDWAFHTLIIPTVVFYKITWRSCRKSFKIDIYPVDVGLLSLLAVRL